MHMHMSTGYTDAVRLLLQLKADPVNRCALYVRECVCMYVFMFVYSFVSFFEWVFVIYIITTTTILFYYYYSLGGGGP